MVEDTPRPTVLVVDDPDRHDRYRTWLPAYDVRTVDTARAGIDALTDDTHVVLLDASRHCDGTLVERSHRRGARVALLDDRDPDADHPVDTTVGGPVDRADVLDAVETLLARSAYAANLDELFVLCKRRADLLDRDADRAETVTALSRRIDTVAAALDTTLDGFAADDFRVAFRDIDTPRPDDEIGGRRRRKTYSHRTQ